MIGNDTYLDCEDDDDVGGDGDCAAAGDDENEIERAEVLVMNQMATNGATEGPTKSAQ